jgi:hypothetical protein
MGPDKLAVGWHLHKIIAHATTWVSSNKNGSSTCITSFGRVTRFAVACMCCVWQTAVVCSCTLSKVCGGVMHVVHPSVRTYIYRYKVHVTGGLTITPEDYDICLTLNQTTHCHWSKLLVLLLCSSQARVCCNVWRVACLWCCMFLHGACCYCRCRCCCCF